MFTSAHICLLYGAMDLGLIGPDRHEITHLSRTWLTLADCVGIAIGAVLAIALLALLIV
jgi:hypothetical protein